MNRSNQALLEAYDKNYRVVNGEIWNKGKRLKGCFVGKGYHSFSVWLNGRQVNVYTHRLVAYQKYGSKIFEEGIEVRHLDGNKLNNLEENIAVGTSNDNKMDIPKEKRSEAARKAWTNRTSEEKSEIGRKISEKIRKVWIARTSEQRSEIARKTSRAFWNSMSPEERNKLARKSWRTRRKNNELQLSYESNG